MFRLLPSVGALWLALLLAPALEGQTAPPFRAYLWVWPEHLARDDFPKALRQLGFHGVSCEPGHDLVRLKALGIPFYLDQVVPGDMLHVRQPVFEVATDEMKSHPARGVPRRPCLRDPLVRARGRRETTEALARLGTLRPDFISVRDEPSFTSFTSPMDWCTGPACQRAFAGFLERRWGKDGVSEAWGRVVEPDEAVGGIVPVATAPIRDAFFHGPHDDRTLVPWGDARAFADATFAHALEDSCSLVRRLRPGVRVGFLGGQMPSAFGGYDWEALTSFAEVIEAYDYGGARDIAHSLARPGTRFLGTLIGAGADPLASVHDLYDRFFEGDQTVVAFSSREVFANGEGLRPTAWAEAIAPHLKRVSSVADLYLRSEEVPPAVAILFSMPSVRLHWLLDTSQDGVSWMKRLTSHQQQHETQILTRQSWIALLEDLGLPLRFVTPSGIQRGCLKDEGLRALVLPRSIALSAAEASEIEAFSARGGLVIADCQTGLYSAKLLRRAKGSLDRLFGIERRNDHVNLDGDRIRKRARTGPWPYPVAETGLAAGEAIPTLRPQGHPILLRREAPRREARPTRGPGTVYLNLLVMDYGRHRIEAPEKAAWLRSQLRTVLQGAGLSPAIDVSRAEDAPPWPVKQVVRRVGDDLLVALHLNLRCGGLGVPWEEVAGRPLRITVRLRAAREVTELLEGRKLDGSGPFDLLLAPDRPALLRLSHP